MNSNESELVNASAVRALIYRNRPFWQRNLLIPVTTVETETTFGPNWREVMGFTARLRVLLRHSASERVWIAERAAVTMPELEVMDAALAAAIRAGLLATPRGNPARRTWSLFESLAAGKRWPDRFIVQATGYAAVAASVSHGDLADEHHDVLVSTFAVLTEQAGRPSLAFGVHR